MKDFILSTLKVIHFFENAKKTQFVIKLKSKFSYKNEKCLAEKDFQEFSFNALRFIFRFNHKVTIVNIKLL